MGPIDRSILDYQDAVLGMADADRRVAALEAELSEAFESQRTARTQATELQRAMIRAIEEAAS